ncbi:MAG: 50S ribosomal protein L11 methyltransferase [Verrucomicrobiota bacterium]
MYRWRKFAESRWLQEREALLQTRAGGALTIIERPGRSRARLEICCRNYRAAKSLLAEFGGQIERLPRDWLQQVLRGDKSKPLKVGGRLVILNVGGASAPRRSPRPRRVLIIPAAAAFGTGEHVTTAMCLRLLEEATRGWENNWRLLDAGTGTGILALAGRCFGAQDVLAIDNDQRAIATAKANARANAIRGVRFVLGDAIRKIGRRKFDVITANLFSELLVSALPFWKTRLRKNGFMILSGVLREQESELLRALRANRFQIVSVRRRGKWIALLCSGGL